MIGADCSPTEIAAYTALLKEFHDVFAWSYDEMPGMDPAIVEHHIYTWLDVRPIRQKQRPIHPGKRAAIQAEIEKL